MKRSMMQSRMRVAALRSRGYSIGRNVYIGKNVSILGEDVSIGDDCWVLDDTTIRGKQITLESNVCIFPRVYINVNELLYIGMRSKISRDCIWKAARIVTGRDLWCNEQVEIGGGGWNIPSAIVRIGPFMHLGKGAHLNPCQEIVTDGFSGIGMECMIFTHGAGQGQSVLKGYGFAEAPVRIGKHVSLNSRVIVTPGTVINDGVTVGAAAFVSGELEPNCLYAGVPAKRKKVFEPLLPDQQKAYIKENYPDLPPDIQIKFSENDPVLHTASCVIDLVHETISGQCTSESEKIRDSMRRHGIILQPIGNYTFPLLNPFSLWERGIELL